MTDYISREAAIFAIQTDHSGEYSREDAIDRIGVVPAADVEPVRHGQCKVWGIDEYYGEWLLCSNCGYEDNTKNAKYCGGCGAKIDLEGN